MVKKYMYIPNISKTQAGDITFPKPIDEVSVDKKNHKSYLLYVSVTDTWATQAALF